MKDDDRWHARTGLIAQAIWDYWNVGSTKCLISVLRSESPLTNADRQLLADFIEVEFKGSREAGQHWNIRCNLTNYMQNAPRRPSFSRS